MSESYVEEYWQERCDDLNSALSRAFSELRELREALDIVNEENARLRSMLSRIEVAMSQGLEL